MRTWDYPPLPYLLASDTGVVPSLRDTPGELWIPQYNLGGAVAAELLVGRSSDTACLVRHVAAEPRGFSFEFVVRLREPLRELGRPLETLHFVDKRRRADALYLEVRFPDGRVFTPPRAGEAVEDELETTGGGGSSEGWRADFWVPALPDAGRVTFACTWEARGIVDATADLEAKKLLAAAKRARPLFDEA
jgi:hypothetical protein